MVVVVKRRRAWGNGGEISKSLSRTQPAEPGGGQRTRVLFNVL